MDYCHARCPALSGLNIIVTYLPDSGIELAKETKIYAAKVQELLGVDITIEDIDKLYGLG